MPLGFVAELSVELEALLCPEPADIFVLQDGRHRIDMTTLLLLHPMESDFGRNATIWSHYQLLTNNEELPHVDDELLAVMPFFEADLALMKSNFCTLTPFVITSEYVRIYYGSILSSEHQCFMDVKQSFAVSSLADCKLNEAMWIPENAQHVEAQEVAK